VAAPAQANGRDHHNGFLRKSGTLRVLRDCPLFETLAETVIEDLAAHARMLQVRGRSVLSGSGERGPGLCILRQGAMKVCSPQRQNREVILALLEPGDFFGEFSGMEAPPGRFRVVALRRCELLVIPASVFGELLLRESGVRLACLQAVARRIRQAEDTLRRLTLENVHGRVEDTLRQLAAKGGESHPDGVLIRRRPSQVLLAGLAGSTRETVSRVLRDLEARRVIACDGRQVLLRC
jgi:CRP-like cAMP-binding protein